MSDTITPIRSGIVPEADAAREMRDTLAKMLQNYMEREGCAPHTLCIALLGDPMNCEQGSDVVSYCPTDVQTSRLHACGAAALLFTRHAIGD